MDTLWDVMLWGSSQILAVPQKILKCVSTKKCTLRTPNYCSWCSHRTTALGLGWYQVSRFAPGGWKGHANPWETPACSLWNEKVERWFQGIASPNSECKQGHIGREPPAGCYMCLHLGHFSFWERWQGSLPHLPGAEEKSRQQTRIYFNHSPDNCPSSTGVWNVTLKTGGLVHAVQLNEKSHVEPRG